MLALFRSKTAKVVTVTCILIFIAAFLVAGVRAAGSYSNLTLEEIDALVCKGQTTDEVIEALGAPDHEDGQMWHYRNARHSYRTANSVVPSQVGVGFDEEGVVELVLKGPAP